MLPGEIHTLHDFIRYCREVLAEQPEYMREKEQEQPASAIVAACVVGSFDVLEKQYPQLTTIFDLASNLEWSNSLSTTTDWRTIKQLVDELERQAPIDHPGSKR
jgi:hypothetical protein